MRNANFLKENNARHMWHAMAHAGDMRKNPPHIINAAEGVEITDIDGHRVLDAVGGLWNVNLGYSCEPVKKAIRDQLDLLLHYSTFRGTSNSPLIELSYELADFFKPDGMTRSFFTSGGSDSIESASRLAPQLHKLKRQPERTKFFALKKGHHGTHFGGASVNGNANFRRAYEPLLPGVFHLPAPWDYRNPFNTVDGAEIAQRIAAQFEDEIAFQGADTIAAFVMEPVLGAGAVMIYEKMVDVFETSKSALASIGHGYTYSGHPVGAAAALACLAETRRLNIFQNAGARGRELLQGLQGLKEEHELVGDARGKGLMCCLELVSNRESKTPVAKDVVQKVQDATYTNGVMIRTSGGNIILSPPLIITTKDVERIIAALDAALAGSR